MKYLLIDIFLAALFLLVLGLGFFGYINFFFMTVMLVVLLILVPYKTATEEKMGGVFEKKDKERKESAARRALIERMVMRVDYMIALVRSLRISIRNFFYVRE